MVRIVSQSDQGTVRRGIALLRRAGDKTIVEGICSRFCFGRRMHCSLKSTDSGKRQVGGGKGTVKGVVTVGEGSFNMLNGKKEDT